MQAILAQCLGLGESYANQHDHFFQEETMCRAPETTSRLGRSSCWLTRHTLPSRVDAPLLVHNVPAWERAESLSSENGRFCRNVLAWEKNGRARSRLWKAVEKARPVYLRICRITSRLRRTTLSKGGILRRHEPILAPAKPLFSKARTMRRSSCATSRLGRAFSKHASQVLPRQVDVPPSPAQRLGLGEIA